MLLRAALKFASQVLLSLFFVSTAPDGLAGSETYTGLMIPKTQEAPIPVSVDLQESQGKLSGRVTISGPISGEGRFVARAKSTHQCDFTTDIGAGRALTFDGYCLARTLEGEFTLRFPDGTVRYGDFRLTRMERVKAVPKKKLEEVSAEPIWTTSACLSANNMCLAACPRGDYNAEFLCANRCRQKLTTCKAKVAKTIQSPVGSANQPSP
jgi:hypothetical protein